MTAVIGAAILVGVPLLLMAVVASARFSFERYSHKVFLNPIVFLHFWGALLVVAGTAMLFHTRTDVPPASVAEPLYTEEGIEQTNPDPNRASASSSDEASAQLDETSIDKKAVEGESAVDQAQATEGSSSDEEGRATGEAETTEEGQQEGEKREGARGLLRRVWNELKEGS